MNPLTIANAIVFAASLSIVIVAVQNDWTGIFNCVGLAALVVAIASGGYGAWCLGQFANHFPENDDK